ncbi:MAG: Trk family potassium uptake protein [Clostridia bacterium]|nr:Trk family potassium uptake protein [Clostridia bacterium]
MTHKHRKKSMDPVQIIVIGFSLVILLGTLLLMMPFSTRSGESAGVVTSLFTATSATCVTGLVMEDTYTFWSPIGQSVILLLIQIGGLGFMMIAAGFSIMVGRRITMRERLLIGKSMNVDDLAGIVRLAKGVIIGTFSFEIAGALILALRFSKDFGWWDGLVKGIWHSVSAFCNAGFDLMGEVKPLSSLEVYLRDPAITLTISLLIIIGGLGFYVWSDIVSNPPNGKLRLHTKLVLTTTGLLLALGTVAFFMFEYHNPATIGNESTGVKLMASFFQSTTARTAGFNQMPQDALTSPSRAMTDILMFIGGSPGSTAGGIKTTTLAVLILAAIAPFKGKNNASAFGKRVPQRAVNDALSVFVIGIAAVTFGAFGVAVIDGVPYFEALFECISAFATVGLSRGLTPTLSVLSHLILIVLMFLGRVGIMTIGVAALLRDHTESKIILPEGKIMIG